MSYLTGGSGKNQPLIERWDGTTWSQAKVSGPRVVTKILNGVATVGPANVRAVGSYSDTDGPNSPQALTEHYTG